MSERPKIHRYEGDRATVLWDAGRCIHAAECVRGLPAVFDPKAKPWIRPDATEVAALAATIRACPSGALKLAAPSESTDDDAPSGNIATVTANGPTYVRGRLTLLAADGSVVLEDTRIALCRCGASGNKPFCDGSHVKAGFADAGALPATASAPASGASGAMVAIRPKANGPIVCTGALTVVGTDGRASTSDSTFLCRCGASQNKPYCDGSHKKIGFVA